LLLGYQQVPIIAKEPNRKRYNFITLVAGQEAEFPPVQNAAAVAREVHPKGKTVFPNQMKSLISMKSFAIVFATLKGDRHGQYHHPKTRRGY
jgi:hypothetical protein